MAVLTSQRMHKIMSQESRRDLLNFSLAAKQKQWLKEQGGGGGEGGEVDLK